MYECTQWLEGLDGVLGHDPLQVKGIAKSLGCQEHVRQYR